MDFSAIHIGKASEAQAILAIFVKCTDALLANGIKQWNYTYPLIEDIQKDLVQKSNYVIKENEVIVGTICLNDQQDDQYQNINWEYESNRVAVIHRLAILPGRQGYGYGKKLCLFAEKWAIENNLDIIRLDAYSGNPKSNQLYEKLGYQKADGYCYFHKNEIPFHCYEKKLL